MKASRHPLALLLLLGVLLSPAPGRLLAQGDPPAPAPANLDFEQGEVGKAPAGWTFNDRSAANGYAAVLVEDKPESGSRCVLIERPRPGTNPWVNGNLTQTLDATPLRGKRVRFRAAVRAETGDRGAPGNGRLTIRVLRPGGRSGFSDNMQDRPITSPEWKTYDVWADVSPDAVSITFGAALAGYGKVWVDSASFQVMGEAGAGNEPARALTDRELENLTAFARLFGYVRYFHPSDQAAGVWWERLALAGVQEAEPAKDPQDLARRLESFFRPIAPTLRVFPTGSRPVPPAVDLARPSGPSPKVVAWSHFGVDTRHPASLYWSRRVNNKEAEAPAQPGLLGQELSATPLRGKKVRVRAAVRPELQGNADARVMFFVVGPTGVTFTDDGSRKPITGKEWQVHEITADVAEDANRLFLGFQLPSGGKLWIDDVAFEVVGQEGKPVDVLVNPGFEEGEAGAFPAGWELSQRRDLKDYVAVSSADHPRSGKRSAFFSYTPPSPPSLPKPEDLFQADLPGGVSVRLPLTLYADEQGTLPRVPADVRPPQPAKPEGFVFTGNDRTTRLADVVLAWNIFQHFFPYFDVIETDWPETLRRSLRSAATDTDEEAFLLTLRRLMVDLHDGHGSVMGPSPTFAHRLPLLWDWIEDRLVVTYADREKAPGIELGSVVLSVGGRQPRQALEALESTTPGATRKYRREVALRLLAAGPENEAVELEIQSPSGKVSTVTLQRTARTYGEGSIQEPRPGGIEEIRPGIFYLDVERFEDHEFQAALDKLVGAKGIIFDVRGYPTCSPLPLQHLLDAPATSARWNVPRVSRPDREGMTFDFSNWDVKPASPRLKAKVAFLTDSRAISYAETFMGIAEHYKLGAIVGEPTAGTNGNVNPFTLPGGYTISWTGMQVLKHDGSQHHGIGIVPTVPVSRTLKGVTEGRDELLEKAIEIVSR